MSKARARSRKSPPTGNPGRSGRSRLPGAALWGAIVAGQLGGAATAVADDPVMIHVRGRSQLRLFEGERKPEDDDRFQLAVHLRLDDGQEPPRAGASLSEGPADPAASGSPADSPAADPARSFAGQRVQIRVRGPAGELAPHTVITGADGRAVLPLRELPIGGYTVVADYAGDELRDAAHADMMVDLGREPVILALTVPPQLGRNGQLPVELRMQSAGQDLTGTVQLRVGAVRHPVSVVRGVGRDTVSLRAQAGLRKGHSLAVLASYPGDRLHSSALVRRDVLITSQARVTLELAALTPALGPSGVAELAQGSALTAVGVVSDEDGPLADEPVDLEASEQPGGEPQDPGARPPGEPPPRPGRAIASGVSDQKGRFRIVIPRLPLRPGPAVLAAQVTPRYHYILPARSAELPLTVLPPEPVSALPYLLPLLVSALGALLWLGGRWLRPWFGRLLAKLRESLRPRRTAPGSGAAASPSAVAAASQELPTGEPGVSLSQGRRLPSLTLRRTIDATIDGQVVDASFGRPVAFAVLTVHTAPATTAPGSEPGRSRTAQATGEGRFVVDQLAAGRYLVEVTAPGYLPQRFAAAIPHRGELRGVSVRLEPIRVRLFNEWRRVAQQLLGQELRLRTATPRELLEQVGRLRGASALSYGVTARELRRLTELVEQAYYSPRVCTPEMLTEATRLADSVLTSGATPSVPLAGAPRPAPGSPVPLS